MMENARNTGWSPPSDFPQRFQDDGFFVYEDLFTQEEIACLRWLVEEIVADTDRWRSGMFHWDAGTGPGAMPTSINEAHFHDWRFFEWATDDRIQNVMRALLGDELAIYNTGVFMKPPHSSVVIPWHQDQVYYAVETDFLVGCWIALTDVTVENGAVKFIPGSYRHGILPTQPPTDPHAAKAFDRVVANVDELGSAVDVPLTAGSAVFQHSHTVHSSGPNTVDASRWGLAVDYMSTDYTFAGSGEARRAYPVVSGH